MENGKIIEDGDPKKLKFDSDSKFASFLRASDMDNHQQTKAAKT